MPLESLALARGTVDRVTEKRADEEWLDAAWQDPGTRVLVVSDGQALARIDYMVAQAWELGRLAPATYGKFDVDVTSRQLLAFGVDTLCIPAGGGMVMSICLTGPREESGLSNSLVFPTTSTASLPLCMYFAAMRFTSAAVTFLISAWYLSSQSGGYP